MSHDSNGPGDQPQPALLRRRPNAALIAIAYLAVLLTPWIVTCVLGSRTVWQSDNRSHSGALSSGTAASLHRVAYLVEVLNAVAALAAVPVIYALLARAAVVFSQRTDIKKTLSVRQLFALADRRFLSLWPRGPATAGKAGTRLAAAGAVLVLLALVLPPIRAILVYSEIKRFPEAAQYSQPPQHSAEVSVFPDQLPNGWVATRVTLDPKIRHVASVDRRHVVEKTRQALINSFPAEWKARAWYDPRVGKGYPPYFASAVSQNTTTGMYRQHALRMNSSVSCEFMRESDFPQTCAGREKPYRLETTYTSGTNLTVKVCVPDANSAPWNFEPASSDLYLMDRQELSETLWIDVIFSRLPPNQSFRSQRVVKCTGDTTLGYFELGNHFNGGQAGPLLSNLRLPIRRPRRKNEFTYDLTGLPLPSELLGRDYGADTQGRVRDAINPLAVGPLSIAAHALFGEDSFFDLANNITNPDSSLSDTLCRLSPIPLQRTHASLRRCEPGWGPYATNVPSQYATNFTNWADDRVFGLLDLITTERRPKSGPDADNPLSTAMYHAAQAVLEAAAVPRGSSNFDRPNQIWRAEGLEVRTHVVSRAAQVVVSVLMGLQVLGILALLWYCYMMPTWTDTLDAFALARLLGQWGQRTGGLFPEDGLWELTAEQREAMAVTDALVGVERPAAEGPAGKTDYLLGFGGPGVISRRMYKPAKGEGSESAVELNDLA